jgi:hypothetical protein
VPCICKECKNSSEPVFHDYNLLLKFRERGIGSQCSKTGEIVSAYELLKITELFTPNKYSKTETNNEIKTIRIFLASSAELAEDRKAFREFISVENDRFHKKGIYLEIVQWEFFIDAMSKDRLQNEYNKAIQDCDIFLSLYFTKVGRFTAEEFEIAFGKFRQTSTPLVYTYFKKLIGDFDNLSLDDFKSRRDFEEKLKSLGHFKSTYSDIHDLQNQFKRQLENILTRFVPTVNHSNQQIY